MNKKNNILKITTMDLLTHNNNLWKKNLRATLNSNNNQILNNR